MPAKNPPPDQRDPAGCGGPIRRPAGTGPGAALRLRALLPHTARFWWGAFAAWNLALLVLSSLPAPGSGPSPVPHVDKVAHFGYFAVGSFAFGFALAAGPRRSPGPLALTLGVFLAIGALDEFHQGFTEGRSGNDAGDLAADVAGAAAGWWIAARLATPRATRRQPDAGTP